MREYPLLGLPQAGIMSASLIPHYHEALYYFLWRCLDYGLVDCGNRCTIGVY